jgi:molybdopterin-guanine dinucleotide biosynthesis protein A
MGRDKALVPVAGKPMLEWVAEALDTAGLEHVVVGRANGIRDDRPVHRGPLAGIATGLRVAAGRDVLAVAVDQPLVRSHTLRRLVALSTGERAVVPIDGGARQVTCALYPAAWAEEAAAEDEASGSIQSLLDRMRFRPVMAPEWRSWGETGASWRSIDTPQDVVTADGLLGGGDPRLAR